MIKESAEVQKITDAMSEYLNMYTLIDQVPKTLQFYINSGDERNLSQYASVCDEIRALSAGAYVDLGSTALDNVVRMADTMMAASDRAIEALRRDDDEGALSSYQEAVYIAELVHLYRPYADAVSGERSGIRLNTASAYTLHAVRTAWIALGLFMCMLTVGCLLTTAKLLRPVRFLTALCAQTTLDSGAMPPKPAPCHNETDRLVDSYYQMMKTIQRQWGQLREQQALERSLQEERKKRAENEKQIAMMQLDVFQSQINSHFLFNSLNLVAKLAYLEHANSARDAAELVARYLRKALEQFNREVTLEEEFDNLNDYLRITRLRFGDRIVCTCTCSPDCKRVTVPSMVLQPLVENAIKHGFSTLPEGGQIRCAATMTGHALTLSVTDNGSGMTAERIARLLQSLTSDMSDTSGHVGIINVYRRLRLRFPHRVTPEISSLPLRHTRIAYTIELTDADQGIRPHPEINGG